jgi:hypothetical protein
MENRHFRTYSDNAETDSTESLSFMGDVAREKDELARNTGQTPEELDATLRQEVIDAQRLLVDRRDQFPF